MPVWQPVDVSERGGDSEHAAHATLVRPDHAGDVADARRGVASFGGGGGPGLRESVREFVRRYGWRAYALPVLLVVTVMALLTMRDTSSGPTGSTAQTDPPRSTVQAPAAPAAPSSMPLTSARPNGAASRHAIEVGALPSGAAYSKAGDGTFRVLKGTSEPIGHGTPYRYDIEVENGITGIDVKQFAALVQSSLSDPRSWSGHGVSVQRVDSGAIDFHVSLTSAMTVRRYCGYDLPVETSCYAAAWSAPGLSVNRVVLNDARWVRGAGPYVSDLHAYRVYMINHEDGHAMSHQHAHQCLPGGLAPVMMQQTFGLKSATTGKKCGANPWPYPRGAAGAPGAEQPDTAANNEYYLGD
jgi:hypothetical protein